jgi:hypothetical protein
MAAEQKYSTAKGNDYPAHINGYDGFIRLLKISTVLTAIIAAIVVYVISN